MWIASDTDITLALVALRVAYVPADTRVMPSNLATASSCPGCNSTAVQVHSRWMFDDDKSCETLVSEQQDPARTDYRYECQWW